MSHITASDALDVGCNDVLLGICVQEAVVRVIKGLGEDRAILSTDGSYVFYVRDDQLYSLKLVTPSPFL